MKSAFGLCLRPVGFVFAALLVPAASFFPSNGPSCRHPCRSCRCRLAPPKALLGGLDTGALVLTAAATEFVKVQGGQGKLAESVAYFAAGGLCAALSHSITTPIDVVKTRKQTVAEYRDLSLLEGFGRIVEDAGPASLFTGVVPTAIGYGLEGALKFGTYEAVKGPIVRMLFSLDGIDSSTAAAVGPIAAAVFAGGLASLVLAPAEATRIRLVSDASFADDSMLSAAGRILEEDGVGGLIRGVPATFTKQMPYTATKQVSFDALSDLSVPTLAAAAIAAILSTLASQPGDAILSEVSKAKKGGGEGGVTTDLSIGAVVQRLGGEGLARGLQARLIHVGLIVTVQLVLYDTLKHAFGVP